MSNVGWLLVMAAGAAAIVWGAETFAEHLADASKRLGVTAFALALLLAGAEPEELAIVVTASVRDVGGVAFGDVIGANAVIVTVALGVGAWITTVPFGRDVRRYALGGLLTGIGALVAPISITDAGLLHAPLLMMLALAGGVIALSVRRDALDRRSAIVLFAGYPLFLLSALS